MLIFILITETNNAIKTIQILLFNLLPPPNAIVGNHCFFDLEWYNFWALLIAYFFIINSHNNLFIFNGKAAHHNTDRMYTH